MSKGKVEALVLIREEDERGPGIGTPKNSEFSKCYKLLAISAKYFPEKILNLGKFFYNRHILKGLPSPLLVLVDLVYMYKEFFVGFH